VRSPETSGTTLDSGAAAEPRWLTDSEMTAWRALISTTTDLMAVLDNELQTAHGLSLGDYEVLVRLAEAPERTLRMNDLANRLHLSPSGMTRRIDSLVRGELVERRQCPTDRRGSNAVLTAKGMSVLEAAAPTHVRGVRQHFIDRLDDEQLATLADALSRVEVDARAAAGGCDNNP
jgi:DNA-binding MarR family transcriptional regulator